MSRTIGLIASAALLAGSAQAADGPDAKTITQQGVEGKIAPCSSCHGADGAGNTAANFPRLAGIGSTYLQAQLDAYASGKRKNPVMGPIASALSKTQRHALAKYYSELALPSGQNNADSTPTDARARELAEHGRWADGIPACTQCHGPGGVGIGEHFPPLAGQPAGYIESQLRAWREGTRAGGPMQLMAAVAAKLDEQDLAPVAHYFAARPATGPQSTSSDKENGDE